MQIEDSTTKIREDPRSNLWGPHSGVLNPAAPYIYNSLCEIVYDSGEVNFLCCNDQPGGLLQVSNSSRCSEASSRTRSHILQKVPCPVGKGFQCRTEYWICLCIRNVTWIVGETSLSEYMVACVCGFCVAFVYYISRDIWAWRWRGMKESPESLGDMKWRSTKVFGLM